ncbi:hypothetical protein [Mycobacterium sp. 360MFTsu5.1]|uniref:hypothetical protein n=1 Tax=Mycobacterium sp. 360MFTsu5.1 TaxID=1172186 RepID=UPI00037C3191|nr:hypothetical protein [Mycobacterium sp. 360MFTsu5.1]
MVDAGSRCVARLNVVVAVATAAIVVIGFVGAAPPGRDSTVSVSAVRLAAAKASMAVQWAALDQFAATHADLMAAAAHVVVGGGSNLSAAAAATPRIGSGTAPTPLAGTGTAPTSLAATSTALPTPQPAGAVAVIEQAIVSALSTAFLTLAQPLVSTPQLAAIFGPFVFLGIILYGLVVGVPLTIFNSIAAPILNLLPFAAVPAPVFAAPTPTAAESTGTVAPTVTVSDPVTPSPKATHKGRALPTSRTPKGAVATADTTGDDVAGQLKSTARQSVSLGLTPAAGGQSQDRDAGGPGSGSQAGNPKGAGKAGAAPSRSSKAGHGSRSVRGDKGNS